MNGIGLDVATRLIAAAQEKAREIAVPMVITIVDDGGNLKAMNRMDGAILASIDISQGKAFTAVACNDSTEAIAPAVQPGQSLYGLHATNGGRIVIFGGGIPLRRGDMLVGAIGVSGGSVEEDVAVATAGARAFE